MSAARAIRWVVEADAAVSVVSVVQRSLVQGILALRWQIQYPRLVIVEDAQLHFASFEQQIHLVPLGLVRVLRYLVE